MVRLRVEFFSGMAGGHSTSELVSFPATLE